MSSMPAPSPIRPTPLAGRHVLVVDDSRPMRLLTRRILELSGATVDQAETGEEALMKGVQPGYDLMLIDLELPGISGAAVAQRLRDRGVRVPLIAVSGHQSPEHQELCRTAGFAAYVGKPFTPSSLVAAVLPLLAAHQCANPAASASGPESPLT
jgi:CheY-like chemotaxis protein